MCALPNTTLKRNKPSANLVFPIVLYCILHSPGLSNSQEWGRKGQVECIKDKSTLRQTCFQKPFGGSDLPRRQDLSCHISSCPTTISSKDRCRSEAILHVFLINRELSSGELPPQGHTHHAQPRASHAVCKHQLLCQLLFGRGSINISDSWLYHL